MLIHDLTQSLNLGLIDLTFGLMLVNVLFVLGGPFSIVLSYLVFLLKHFIQLLLTQLEPLSQLIILSFSPPQVLLVFTWSILGLLEESFCVIHDLVLS